MASSSRTSTSSQRTSRLSGLLSVAILLASAGMVYGSVRLGIQLIFDPNAATWLNRFLPDWTRIPTANPQLVQTLGDIKAVIRQSGFIPGEMLPLQRHSDKVTAPPAMVLPVMAPIAGCSDRQACLHIVELRVYQPVDIHGKPLDKVTPQKRAQFFWLISQVGVTGPEESLVTAPISDAYASGSISNQPLPLTDIEIFQDQAPKLGIWLNLKGKHTRGSRPLFYGQVLHYNPETSYLGSLLSWSGTPSVPVWQEFTGGGLPELIIDHTIDLEPQYKVYRIKPRKFLLDPIQLEPISLREPAISTRAYQSILTLAQSGLWTPAQQWLEAIKQQVPAQQWTADAQAQLDYIRLHAEATTTQAKQQWGSASQQIFVYLIDGQWARALATMQANLSAREEILTLLKTDSGRLWNRVTAALKVNPSRADVQFWGALILMSQQGKTKAMAWVRKQPGSDADYVKAIRLMNQLDPPQPVAKSPAITSPSSPSPSSTTTSDLSPSAALPPSNHPSRIIGTAIRVSNIDLRSWSVPNGNSQPSLGSGQHWYEVIVNRFHDGKVWRRSPIYDLPSHPNALWNLMALDNDPYLTLMVLNSRGQQQTLTVTVQAVRAHGGEVRLLAVGEATSLDSSLPILALSNQAIVRLQPSTISLAALSQQNAPQAARLMQSLWSDLQQAGLLLPGAPPTLTEVLSRTDLGSWQLEMLDLTGNQKPELILKLDGEAIARTATQSHDSPSHRGVFTGSRTLIFADTGALLYSELTTEANQMLVTIADLGDSRPPRLLVYSRGIYNLQQWSAHNWRFE